MIDRIEAAPKVELHLHLEGAIPAETLWSIIADHGGDDRVDSPEALIDHLRYRDFAHFIERWTWMTGYLREPADFTRVGTAVAASLAAQHIVYAEASISPTDYTRHGVTVEEIIVATRAGLDRVPDVDIGLIVDLVRDTGPARAAVTLESVIDVADDAGVIGITIGGSEQDHPPAPFAPTYARAAAAGLHRTAHGGEAAGPVSIWDAIRLLGVERVGHGIRAVEDPDLVRFLVEHQIPLEVCPTSNLRTGVVTGWDNHPVHTLLNAGANVTISTDDPTFFHVDLASELRALEDSGFSARDLTLRAVAASWLDEPQKAALRDRVRRFWDTEPADRR